ncbi:DNA polymerase III, beta subunit [Balnearium lithotrophicum]|uniref:Beta sliding clamp n=1 Tax=Balnearium lithotrophicum TaxID=223788 RepID=A0A521CK19_9BACT|nr:DNA polymerase III subunit beta [Balnearium lithotrophicum]SMO59752.1 DNA polymerase III, beta subunit [Balnearium lithotrophicum]
MKVEVKRKDLSNALKKLLKTADLKGTIPILSCLLAELENGKLRLTTTNLEVTGWAEIPAKFQSEKGSFVFPIKRLEKIVSKAKGNSVVFEVRKGEEEREIIVDTGKTSFSFNEPHPVEEFPEISREFKPLLEMDTDTFLNISKKLLPFTSDDEAREILNSLYIEAKKDALHFIASNGHYLAWYRVDWEEPPDEEFQILIRRKVISLFKNFLSNSQSVEIGTFSDDAVGVRAGNYYLTWKTIEGTYPDWRAVVPEDNPNKVTFCRKTLLESIDEVSVLFEKDSFPCGKLEILKKELTLSAKELVDGKYQKAISKIEIDSNVSGEPATIGFNLNHLSTTLKTFSKETIKMLFNTSAISPVLFECSQEPELKVVVMPVKL